MLREASDPPARDEEALRRLSEASEVVEEAPPDEPRLLETIARVLSEATGDACTIRLLSEDRARLVPAAVHHPDPALRAEIEAAARATERADVGLWAPVMRDRRTAKVVIAPGEVPAAASPEQVAFLREHPSRCILFVPLVARGALIGGLSLIRAASQPACRDEEEALVRSFAARAALAIDNARLFARERAAREAAERAADRMGRLQALTQRFAYAITPARVAELVLRSSMPVFGATAAWFALVTPDGGHLEAIASEGYSAEDVARWRRTPLDADLPLPDALRAGEAIFIASEAEIAARYPGLRERAPLRHRAWASVPLLVEDRAVGGFILAFAEERAFTEEDRSFLLFLGRIAAQAVERARLYDLGARARAEAEAANRAKDEFLAVLSHELRTPLTAILGWAQILRTRPTDASTRERALEIIYRNARSQTRLIEDILDVSRIVAGKMRLSRRSVDPTASVRTALDLLAPAADAKGVTVIARIAPDLGVIWADADRLQQIALNLFSNAVKFTPRGGRVEVELARGPSGVRLRVADTGKGIPTEFLPHVFERFRQADAGTTRSHGGLGLGLAIAKHLVDLHRGTIVAESDGPDRGATFTVTLPVEPPEEDGHTGSDPDVTGPFRTQPADRLAGVRVLVAEDDADSAELIGEILRAEGALVTITRTAEEALAAGTGAAIDVLVSDIGMPDEDGYTLLVKLRAKLAEKGRSLPAVALTAYTGADDVKQAYQAGFQMHLPKPLKAKQIVEAVGRLAGRGG